ncbi:MAG: Rrf2 family transcriptional regulator [Clostridiaceae bacterium]|jgi:Rrf2 family cysteine metabolism transcriptional repressor|nr:Rrf2 family transcriptional regulator [Clostridiaceae bacterium]
MKISTRGQYGLEALIGLALKSTSTPVSLKSITSDCGLSESYILQIFLMLKKAGILTSVRGAQGGYMLSREPSQISVRQVLEAVEGPLAPVSCIVDDCNDPCGRYKMCAARLLWEKVKKRMDSLVDSITLADLVENVYAVDARENPDYSI